MNRKKLHPKVPEDLIERAEAYPHRCLCPKLMGPDPVKLHESMEYGHFIRLPRTDGYNVWCFESDDACQRFQMHHHNTMNGD